MRLAKLNLDRHRIRTLMEYLWAIQFVMVRLTPALPHELVIVNIFTRNVSLEEITPSMDTDYFSKAYLLEN